MRFFHCSDVHLGREGPHPERRADMHRAFESLLEKAARERVPVVLVAGDLFDSTHPDPETLLRAERALEAARDAGVRVLAVEGNHDRATSREGGSWPAYLEKSGLLVLLSPEFQGDEVAVSAWEPLRSGAYIDIGEGKDRIRFTGLSFQGALLDQRLIAFARKLPETDAPTVFMLHADPDWTQAPEGTVLTSVAKEVLRSRVAYLALGHRHQKRSREGWIWNPGSLEATHLASREEVPARGFWDVRFESGQLTPFWVESEHRAIRIVRAPCDGVADENAIIEASRRALDEALAREALPASLPASDLRRPLICISLVGRTNFASRLLDERALEDALRSHPSLVAARPLALEVRNRTVPPGMVYVEGDEDGGATGDELQRQIEHVLTTVAEQYPVASVSPSEVARLSRRIKACTEDLDGDSPETPAKRASSASDRLLARVRAEIQAVLG